MRATQPVTIAARSARSALSALCNIEDWESAEFEQLGSDIMARRPAGHSPAHRKLWEFVRTVQALQATGHWHDRSCGLSVAAGTERLLYYMSNFIGRIVATDIYGDGDFASREADTGFLRNPERFAPYAFERSRLRGLYMNALDLRFPENTFDFAFSLSSIEHFGSRAKAAAALRQMARVVRPGGVVIITTECAINGKRSHDVFLPGDLLRIAAASGLNLVGPIDWNVTPRTLENVIDMRKGDLNQLPHVALSSLGSVFTSVCLVLEKPGWKKFPARDLERFDLLMNDVAAQPLRHSAKLSGPAAAAYWCQRKGLSVCYRAREFFGG